MGTNATSLELQPGRVVHRGDAGDIEARIATETTGKKAGWRSNVVLEWFCKMKGGSARHPPSPPATDVRSLSESSVLHTSISQLDLFFSLCTGNICLHSSHPLLLLMPNMP